MSDILQAKTITGEYSGFADSALRDVSGTFLTAVPDTYLQNTDLTITDNKVTEISGIPLSTGTELEFEYDAADNISAINNSAISTTPAQALYAQNPLYFSATGTSSYIGIQPSAQYNETVLWSGDASAFSLSEAATGFDNLQLTYYPTEGGTACSTVMYVPSTATSINLFSKYLKVTNDFVIEDVTKFTTNDFTNYSYGAGVHAWYSTLMERQGGAGGDCFNRVTKVVGVNRKENA